MEKTEEMKNEGKKTEKTMNDGKLHIYNLLILDESGSMSSLKRSTLSGVNEVIGTIRQAQKDLGDKQTHYLTLVTFDSRGDGNSVRTLLDAEPIGNVEDFSNYHPNGCTPLYDAMGMSLSTLRGRIEADENATAVVTVVTDGLENDSQEYTGKQVKELIEQLKELGWTFSYMGSAHDVKEVTDLLSIENVMEFSHDVKGSTHSWNRDSESRMNMFCEFSAQFCASDSLEKKRSYLKNRAKQYLGERVTPDPVTRLQENEVLVFGSDGLGRHGGGLAAYAVQHFGAVVGCAEGMQGQCYAIPTTEGLEKLRESVNRFLDFAEQHQEKHFLVTRIGCGHAGFRAHQVAEMMERAVKMRNVSLPEEFWEVLGVRNF